MYLKISGYSIWLFVFFSCNNPNKNTAVVATQSPQPETISKFIPVTDFISGQLNEIESLPVTPLKLITVDNKKSDSVWMKREDVRGFAQPFLLPVIDSLSLSTKFRETSFMDETVNAFTFSYDPISGAVPDSFLLKRWDVYISPETNLIKRVFIVKEIASGKDKTTMQLTWLSGYWCKITYIKETGNKTELREEKVIWDFKGDQ
ncbi:hypothetical protein BH09BAC2_BH09BAC2_07380 [soil metagenome]